MTDAAAIATSREVLAAKSKSFAMAAKLLPPSSRDAISVVYAWCRRADDAIDLAPVEERAGALVKLRAELVAIYEGELVSDPVVQAFGDVARIHGIPRIYPEELLAGMEMDVARATYDTVEDLLRYCYRVASVVGLMLCHVMGLDVAAHPDALRRAAHLGIAMQLTNICRDVEEDLADGRIYVPTELLPDVRDRDAVKRAVARLLALADGYYRSADLGIVALPFRCALAVHAARLVYSRIGDRLRARGCDPFLGRVFVPTALKLLLVLFAIFRGLAELPARLRSRPSQSVGKNARRHVAPDRVLGFPHDVLPV